MTISGTSPKGARGPVKLLRWIGIICAGILILLIVAWFTLGRAPEIAAISSGESGEFSSEMIEQGEVLAAIGDCAVCHTASDGVPLAGGLGLPTPFGTIYSTNITPDPETGIGKWSEVAFRRAMREGFDREGNHLYPAFPYDHFTKATDEDIGAIYAYLMDEPAVQAETPPNTLRFPFGFRPLLAGWKILFFEQGVFTPDPALDEEQNRGAYLVEGLAHCGACHSPRNAFGAVKSDAHLGGGDVEGWYVPPLGKASEAPLPWTTDAYVNYLYDGWDEEHGLAAGPMTPVVDHLYDVPEEDVFAIAAYLENLAPPPANSEQSQTIAAAIAARDWAEAERPGGQNAPEDPGMLRGEVIFAAQCVKCHKERVSKKQPASLGLSATVTAPDARNLLSILVHGIIPPTGSRDRTMPNFRRGLTEPELIDLSRFLRWRFTDLPPWQDLEADLAANHAND